MRSQSRVGRAAAGTLRGAEDVILAHEEPQNDNTNMAFYELPMMMMTGLL